MSRRQEISFSLPARSPKLATYSAVKVGAVACLVVYEDGHGGYPRRDNVVASSREGRDSEELSSLSRGDCDRCRSPFQSSNPRLENVLDEDRQKH